MKTFAFRVVLLTCLLTISTAFLCGCWGSSQSSEPASGSSSEGSSSKDLKSLRVDESGRIVIVMFHQFVDKFTGTSQDDKQYTTTFDSFRNLLGELYDQKFRMVGLNDYISGNIDVPAGFKPIVFTFDDCTPGQFSLAEKNGSMVASSNSAVGILQEFNNSHPDFGAKGTFFIYTSGNPFSGGAGTLQQKLKYLVDNGFEIGNHTLTQVDMNTLKKRIDIQKELGLNQKKLLTFLPGYTMQSLSLPYGSHPRNIFALDLLSGEYEGVKYQNKVVLEVGWDPAISPFSAEYDASQVHRIRAAGIVSTDYDLTWWLRELKRDDNLFVSDGNPKTVTSPSNKQKLIDHSKLGDKTVVSY